MPEDGCVDLLRWNNNNFKELGRKLKFRAKIGEKMGQKLISIAKGITENTRFLKTKLGQNWQKDRQK